MKVFLIAILSLLTACGNHASEIEAADTTSTQLITDSLQMKDLSRQGISDLLQKKANAGIDLFAIGQEPGWTLDMDLQNQFSFSSYEGISMSTPAVNGTIKGDTTFYKMNVEMGQMNITFIHQKCQDIMSGEEYPYQVRVSLKRGIDSVFRNYQGCGRFLR